MALVSTAGVFWRWQREKFLRRTKFDPTPWLRIVQRRSWEQHIRAIGAGTCDTLEISPDLTDNWSRLGFKSYSTVGYPDFDICAMQLEAKFNVIIADNVFEHVRAPVLASRNVHAMLKEDGVFLISAPFLFKVHARPHDYWRWTKDGLREVLVEAGFNRDKISLHDWGNRGCAVANLDRIVPYGWGRSLENDDDFPLMVWAFAKK